MLVRTSVDSEVLGLAEHQLIENSQSAQQRDSLRDVASVWSIVMWIGIGDRNVQMQESGEHVYEYSGHHLLSSAELASRTGLMMP